RENCWAGKSYPGDEFIRAHSRPRGKIVGQGYFLKRHTPASKQTFLGARVVRPENRVSRRFIPTRDLRISPCEKAESDKKECSRDRQSDISSYHASPSGK